eukprot:14903189-Alexandrium_andersonii.AAC.1
MGGWFDLEALCNYLNTEKWSYPKPFTRARILPAHVIAALWFSDLCEKGRAKARFLFAGVF